MKRLLFALSIILSSASASEIDFSDPFIEAQLIAIEISGQLVAPNDLTSRILGDLALIRDACPQIAGITYRPHYVPDELMVGITEEAVQQYQQGQYHALDSLNQIYGVVEVEAHFGLVNFLLLKFNQVYNMPLLAQIYTESNLEGVKYAEANYLIGDGPTIIVRPPYYLFIDAWGDCPSGCSNYEFWEFKVESGQVTLSNMFYVDAQDGNDTCNGLFEQTAFATIQHAIETALDGDTVIVADGVYTGTGNRDIDFLGKAIIVKSQNGPNDCIIDCQASGSNPHRAFYFHNNEDANSILGGFAITNGYSDLGGAVYCQNSSPTIKNCLFTFNLAEHGGAVLCENSDIAVTSCVFNDNHAMSAGAIKCRNYSNPVITGCSFSRNLSDRIQYDAEEQWGFGGAIVSYDNTSLTLVNCDFVQNRAVVGGAVNHFSFSDVNMVDCTFLKNRSGSEGGAVTIRYCNTKIENCTFELNVADNWNGGAIDCYGCQLVEIKGCSFISNILREGQPPYGGGGINSYSKNLIVENCLFENNLSYNGGGLNIQGENGCAAQVNNCTFVKNSSYVYGGAISSTRCNTSLNNCILWGNSASLLGDEIFLSRSVLDVDYSNITGELSEIIDDYYQNSTINWGLGNIDVDPCFVSLGYLDLDCKPQFWNDCWLNGDYHLKSEGWRWDSIRSRWDWDDVTSRCIDAGNPGSPLGDETLFVEDPIWGTNKRINMGVYGGTAQASIPPQDWALLSDIDNNGIVDLTDFAQLSLLWFSTGPELFADFNRDEIVDYNDIEPFSADWLNTTSWNNYNQADITVPVSSQ
ncbi:MAG: right-handed parallel beta-helix repeat-containing protein [Phycisphaerae bacterium]|jgi:predicted outer membrane repeat protein